MKMAKLLLFLASTLVGSQVAADGNYLVSLLRGGGAPNPAFSDNTETSHGSFVSTDRYHMQDFAGLEDFPVNNIDVALPIEDMLYDDHEDDHSTMMLNYQGHYRSGNNGKRHLQKKAKEPKAPSAPKASKKSARKLQSKKESFKDGGKGGALIAPTAPKAPIAPKASKKRNRKLHENY